MADRRLGRFLWLYPLANIGAYVAFLPLLTLLVPLRAAHLAGAGKVALLSEALIAGVLVATFANVAAGALSDWSRARFGTRLPWLFAGLAGSWLGYVAIVMATGIGTLIGGVILFQFFFNMLFGPMSALFADKVPDHLKGRISAFANLALPAGSLATALIGSPLFAADGARALMLTLLTGALILPLLLAWPRGLPDATPEHQRFSPTTTSPQRRLRSRESRGRSYRPEIPASAGMTKPEDGLDSAHAPRPGWAAFRTLWVAKFLVQLAGNVVQSYFLFYLQDGLHGARPIGGASIQTGFAVIIAIATVATSACSLIAGRASDRTRCRKPFLLGAAAIMATGLLFLLPGSSWLTAAIGYAAFSTGLGIFLTIDIALVAQILPSERHRGRDLGLMNVANTLPAVVGPILVFAVLRDAKAEYGAIFAILLIGLCGSALALAGNRRLR